jgi:hypothetical protein
MKNFTLFVFTLFTFSVLSCQDEEESVVQDTTNNFTKSAPISLLISRVSQYETTRDNVLDGTSNCSIKLPAHVTVNGQYVNVLSENDFQTVQNIKNQSNSDDDIVHFGYPITMVYPNHYEHVVTNETQLNYIMAQYGDDSPYHEVACLNFNYPFSINIYNTNNQVGSTLAIQSDTQLYNFIHNLTESQIVGITFPITLTKSGSQQITINHNTDLENAINDAVNSCYPGSTPTSLWNILTTGSWHISYCFYGQDATSQYAGYYFTFHPNGDVLVVKNSITLEGDWDLDDGVPQRLDFNFEGSQLHDLETNWDVQEYTSTYIRLRKSSGGGTGQQSYMSFTKN